ncbi:MAG: hypothetical protein ACRDY4_02605 [Acidimicrobiia bacterium]
MNVDDLELELRKLPGVRAAGFSEREDMLFVQVQAGGDDDPGDSGLALQASRIAARHSELPVTVELVRWREPTVARREGRPPAEEAVLAGATGHGAPRAENRGTAAHEGGREPRLVLLAVLVFPDADEIEVHLTRGEQRAIGRAPASGGAISAVQATVAAVKGFCSVLPYAPGWARTIETTAPSRFLVAVALFAPGTQAYRYGLAAGDSEPEAAARATLHALNRVLALELQVG